MSIRTCIAALAALCVSTMACGQGFINLDFEQAAVPPIEPGTGFPTLAWQLAAPGWMHSDAPDTQYVYYNNSHLGITPAYTLLDSLSPVGWPRPLEGAYSLMFRNGTFSSSEPLGWVNAFIAQTGAIPPDTRSVRLLAAGIFRVYVNGIELQMMSLGGNAFVGDISAFAGTLAELKILNAARPIAEEVSVPVVADAIEFSAVPIPEPGGGALVLAGGLILWAMRWRN